MMIMMEIIMIAGGLDEIGFKDPFQTKPFCDSMTMTEMMTMIMMMMMERPYLF